MAASSYFKKLFTKKSLQHLYYSSIRYKGAVGIDGVNSKIFAKTLLEDIDIIYKKARNGSYTFSQYREKLISRGQDKRPRVISIPTIRDKLTQKALADVLHQTYSKATPFLHQIVNGVSGTFCDNGYDSVIKLDVKEFYPSIKHDLLIKELGKRIRTKEILSLIKNAISQPTVFKPKKGFKNRINKGIPQGLSISNILANIYILPIDVKHRQSSSYAYFRYVDDILIFCHSDDIDNIREDITKDCEALGLTLHSDGGDGTKSSSGSISDGFSYLGYDFSPALITVRKKSVDRLCEKIINLFSSYKHSKEPNDNALKWVIDLRITGCIFNGNKYGWLFYFSQINDLVLLKTLDNLVVKQTKRFVGNSSQIKIKKFTRAYHEITKNFRQTTYVPNFDNMPTMKKQQLLIEVFGFKDTINMSDDSILYQFNKHIYRAVKDLEKDLAKMS